MAEASVYVVNGLFANDGTPDDNGLLWYLNADGLDSPPVESVFEARAHLGSYPLSSQFTHRLITLTGHVTAPDYPALKAGRDRWFAACDLTRVDGYFRVLDAVPFELVVWLAERPTWKVVHEGLAELGVTLAAPDPRRYSVIESQALVSGGAILANNGSALTHPRLEVAGMPAGGGGDLVINGQVSVRLVDSPAGDVVVDVYDRTVTVAGVAAFPVDSAASLWVGMEAGNNDVEWVGDGSAPNVFYRDAS